ncbi:hypothetical protein K438DRAFT_1818290 [Mycena galopus ATCC 62051]|nr:hypothetical protein K438DRAFT_1818290 [Mycena galopus ATCC 62051]
MTTPPSRRLWQFAVRLVQVLTSGPLSCFDNLCSSKPAQSDFPNLKAVNRDLDAHAERHFHPLVFDNIGPDCGFRQLGLKH